jgi:hypothetical protein
MTPRPATNRAPATPLPQAAAAQPVEETLRIHLVPARPSAPPRPRALVRVFLISEFLLLFVAIPLTLFFRIDATLPPLPALWAVAAYCLFALLGDSTFDHRQLWNAAPLARHLPEILALFATGVVVISTLVATYLPHLFLGLPRTHPRAWLLLLLAYVTLSVYPQGLIFRAFIFHRYRPLLSLQPQTRSLVLILFSASAFTLMHVVFHNWVALALTFPGGVIFARRYADTGSLFVSSLEHALYGCLLFTVGLAPYFLVRVV